MSDVVRVLSLIVGQEAAVSHAQQAALSSQPEQQQQQQQQASQQPDTSTQLPMQPPTPSSAAAAAATASVDLAPAAPSSSGGTPAAAGSSGPAAGGNDKGVNAQVLQRYKELLLQTEERCRSAERQASLSGVWGSRLLLVRTGSQWAARVPSVVNMQQDLRVLGLQLCALITQALLLGSRHVGGTDFSAVLIVKVVHVRHSQAPGTHRAVATATSCCVVTVSCPLVLLPGARVASLEESLAAAQKSLAGAQQRATQAAASARKQVCCVLGSAGLL